MIRTEHKGTKVESFKRELDKGVDFLTTAEAILVAGRLKALETDDDDAGDAVYFERFRRLHMVLALVAIPLVIFVEDFGLLEVLEALG